MSASTSAVPAEPASTPDRGPRPATAIVAVLLQLLIVLLAAALVAVAWIGYGNHDQLIDRAAELVPAADPAVVATERDNNLFGAVMLSAVFGLITLWFGATLWPAWRGSNVARVLATVGAGMQTAVAVLFVCGGGLLGLLFLPLTFSGPGFPGGDPSFEPGLFEPDPFHDKLFELQNSGAGTWPGAAVAMGGLLLTLLAGALLVLLLVPPSNRWFSPRPLTPRPLTPGPTAVPVYYPVHYPAPGPAPGMLPAPGMVPPPGQPASAPSSPTAPEPPTSAS